jgi:hypothetical protein
MGIWCSQFRQTLAKDPLPTFPIYTEELAHREDQSGGDTFPRQISQAPPVSAVRFVRLPPQDGQEDFSGIAFATSRISPG